MFKRRDLKYQLKFRIKIFVRNFQRFFAKNIKMDIIQNSLGGKDEFFSFR